MQNPSYFSEMTHALHSALQNAYALVAGLIITVVGYFIPVKDIVHLLILFFILDVVFGYCAARKLRNERFSVKIIWEHTMPRMLISIVLISGAFLWDSVYKQEVVSTYKIIGWFISGVLLYSIAENGYQITKWGVFPKIGSLFRAKIQDDMGMDIDIKKENKEDKTI